MSEGRLREEISRGQKAAEIVRNPVFDETFDILRSRYATMWADTDPKDTSERERMYVAINVLEDIYDHIVSVMQTGRMADEELHLGPEGSPIH